MIDFSLDASIESSSKSNKISKSESDFCVFLAIEPNKKTSESGYFSFAKDVISSKIAG